MLSTLCFLALPLVTPATVFQGPPPSPVGVDPVGLEEVQDRRLVTGRVRAARRALVAAREAGIVEEVLAREGAEVEAGDPLVVLDATLIEVELAINAAERVEAEAYLTEREARLRQAATDLAAVEELEQRGAANPKELGDARSTYAAMDALLAGARAALETNVARRVLLERRLADMRPVAPFAGTVVSRRVESGEWVQPGGALVELVATKELEAWLDVPQGLYAAVSATEGPFELSLDAGGTVRALSRRVLPEVTAGARTFTLVAALEADPSLAPGMTLTAQLPTGGLREALTVHRDAVLRNEVGAYVYMAVPGGEGAPHQAVFAPVELLFFTGERAAVRSPVLQPGALVVTEGNERLYPTAPITPMASEQGEQR